MATQRCLHLPRMADRPLGRPPGRPLQGAFQDEDVQKFLASQNTCEEERIERLERLKSGPVPKTRFDAQREASEARRKRDEEESREAYNELLHDLETGDKKKGVLGTQQFVKKGGEAYVPARPTQPEVQVPARRAPERAPTPDPPPKAARKGALTDLLSEIQRYVARLTQRPSGACGAPWSSVHRFDESVCPGPFRERDRGGSRALLCALGRRRYDQGPSSPRRTLGPDGLCRVHDARRGRRRARRRRRSCVGCGATPCSVEQARGAPRGAVIPPACRGAPCADVADAGAPPE